jgi:NAD(P)-dependent dehydrogenase (short-subunit alcohol dehydrogenase family)
MELDLRGRRALVSGSSSGIGEATVTMLAQEGAIVFVHGRDPVRTEAVAARLRAVGATARVVLGDLTDEADVARIGAAIDAATGGIDILVNNAGGRVGGWSRENWSGASSAQWIDTYRLNVVASASMIKRFLPGMIERGWGRCIQIASCVALGQPPFFADYQAAKAAEMNMSRSLARSLGGTGVTSNCVSAGIILTPGSETELRTIARDTGIGENWQPHERRLALEILQQRVGRIGRGTDIAAAVAFLSSPQADFITGQNLQVDGGA